MIYGFEGTLCMCCLIHLRLSQIKLRQLFSDALNTLDNLICLLGRRPFFPPHLLR